MRGLKGFRRILAEPNDPVASLAKKPEADTDPGQERHSPNGTVTCTRLWCGSQVRLKMLSTIMDVRMLQVRQGKEGE